MSLFEQENEYEYQPRTWSKIPDRPQGRVEWLKKVGGAGVTGMVEIKPHSDDSRTRGRGQLRDKLKLTRWTSHQPWLVTYVALGPTGRPISRGRAQQVRVFAAHLTDGSVYDLGIAHLPATIPFPRVDSPGFFGHAVEKPVQDHLSALLTPRGKVIDRATGGATPGPDLTWRELAEMYAELAQELRDPFLRELAHELSAA